MIACYHTQILNNWTDNDLHHKLSLLPASLRDRILIRQPHLDVQLSVTGYLLLLKLIDHFGLDLKLGDLQYGPHQRPYFMSDFDFNISHSGNRIICCATTIGTVGVDIELMKPVDINLADYFTTAEQQNIRAAKNTDNEFFRYWTRKEAVLKAAGTGVYSPLLDIVVCADEVMYQDKTYYLLPIAIDADFAGHVACTIKQDISIKKVEV